MAVIDTLKLARALHNKGGFTQEAADATAEALNAALGKDVATKADIKLLDGSLSGKIAALDGSLNGKIAALDGSLNGKIAALDGKITLLLWALGINIAATVTMLVKHW